MTVRRNDNRNYTYAPEARSANVEYAHILDLVPPRSRVLDLGCGDGSLLARLRSERQCEGLGVELSESGVAAGVAKGLDVRQGRIDVAPLPFADGSFDVAVCNVTLQMVVYPEVLLGEMKRVARAQVVSFPNFAWLPQRLELLLLGRMPRSMLGGYAWHDTGHIHQLAFSDFESLAAGLGLQIVERRYHFPPGARHLGRLRPGLFATLGVFLTRARRDT